MKEAADGCLFRVFNLFFSPADLLLNVWIPLDLLRLFFKYLGILEISVELPETPSEVMAVGDPLIRHDTQFHDLLLIGISFIINIGLLDRLSHGDEDSGSPEFIEMMHDGICSDGRQVRYEQ